jgi:hypothetical protein
MMMVVEDNYTVRLDGVWLHGKDRITAALQHIYSIDPKADIWLIMARRSSVDDGNQMIDLIYDVGLHGGFVEMQRNSN